MRYLILICSCKKKKLKNVLDDESDTATEGEEDIKAREIRKQEVCLRIPDISTATTDTGSDTEVIFVTPELIENNVTSSVYVNKYEEGNSIPNKTNNVNSSTSQNLLNANSQTNAISNNICNPDKSTNSCLSPNNNYTSKIPSLEKQNVLLNSIIITNENKNSINNMCNLSYAQETEKDINLNLTDNRNSSNELMNGKKEVFSGVNNKHSEIVTSKVDNHEHFLDSPKCNRKQQQLSLSIKTNDGYKIEGDIQSNNFINDSHLSETGVVRVKNHSKPIRLNVVTTEPYPKYTPTVEKAIKKYEDKQPKKECIVM